MMIMIRTHAKSSNGRVQYLLIISIREKIRLMIRPSFNWITIIII